MGDRIPPGPGSQFFESRHRVDMRALQGAPRPDETLCRNYVGRITQQRGRVEGKAPPPRIEMVSAGLRSIPSLTDTTSTREESRIDGGSASDDTGRELGDRERLARSFRLNVLATVSRFPASLQQETASRLGLDVGADEFAAHGIDLQGGELFGDPLKWERLLADRDVAPERLFGIAHAAAVEFLDTAEDPPPGERAALDLVLIKKRFVNSIRLRVTRHLPERTGSGGTPRAGSELDMALMDGIFGSGRELSAFLARHEIGPEVVRAAIGSALEEIKLVGNLAAADGFVAVDLHDDEDYRGSRGGCAKFGAIVANTARHGLVKSVSAGTTYAVKETIATASLAFLDRLGMDFFWAGYLSDAMTMFYYAFGYDEVQSISADVLNALFVGQSFKENRDQALRWRVAGEIAGSAVPALTIAPASEAIMGLTGVSAEDRLVEYALSKIAAKMLEGFGSGMVQSVVRRNMRNTYSREFRERRDFNGARRAGRKVADLNRRFKDHRKVPSIANLIMRVLLYQVVNALHTYAFYALDPLEEAAAGYQSDAQDRAQQKLLFNVMVLSATILMTTLGQYFWSRWEKAPVPDGAEGGVRVEEIDDDADSDADGQAPLSVDRLADMLAGVVAEGVEGDRASLERLDLATRELFALDWQEGSTWDLSSDEDETWQFFPLDSQSGETEMEEWSEEEDPTSG